MNSTPEVPVPPEGIDLIPSEFPRDEIVFDPEAYEAATADLLAKGDEPKKKPSPTKQPHPGVVGYPRRRLFGQLPFLDVASAEERKLLTSLFGKHGFEDVMEEEFGSPSAFFRRASDFVVMLRSGERYCPIRVYEKFIELDGQTLGLWFLFPAVKNRKPAGGKVVLLAAQVCSEMEEAEPPETEVLLPRLEVAFARYMPLQRRMLRGRRKEREKISMEMPHPKRRRNASRRAFRVQGRTQLRGAA